MQPFGAMPVHTMRFLPYNSLHDYAETEETIYKSLPARQQEIVEQGVVQGKTHQCILPIGQRKNVD